METELDGSAGQLTVGCGAELKICTHRHMNTNIDLF